MNEKVFLITPPFTQLNTPYPATAYLQGFLKSKGIAAEQSDLGLELVLKLFCKAELKQLFEYARNNTGIKSGNICRMLALQDEYLKCIDPVIAFLQDKNPTLAYLIAERNYLPEASLFEQCDDLEWAFGVMGIRDKARHLCTLFLEDLSDLIVECIDPHFGFTRYAEQLGRSALYFDDLQQELEKKPGIIQQYMLDLLDDKIKKIQPSLVAVSVPFPGNLLGGFRIAQHLRNNHPEIKIVLGGGFANTELRSLSDPRVFDYFHFITLDDGEAPLMHLLEHLRGERKKEELKRCFVCVDQKVEYINNSSSADYKQKELPAPDYSGLQLNAYLSVIEMANPMHRLWSDGRWNKLTLAHGCYWGKCTFCDISLDYISSYEFASAKLLVDRIEELIAKTGHNGFHFVDEAAPPSLMRELALELLRRKLTVVWWTNIRFEKSFSYDLCRLLAASGCIAVSGGLEVASDRLLKLIDKGVSVEQVAKVTHNFTRSGIMVHAYLMYGFPTQNVQETVDALEVVRQLFEEGIVQSGFWHRFAMTAHSPVGMHPEKFGVERIGNETGTFANNDLEFYDPTPCDHEAFSEGLKTSLFNYMHGVGFDFPLQKWFDFKIPKTKLPSQLIRGYLQEDAFKEIKDSQKVIWTGNKISAEKSNKKTKGTAVYTRLVLFTQKETFYVDFPEKQAQWLMQTLNGEKNEFRFGELKERYEQSFSTSFLLLWHSREMQTFSAAGLLLI